MADNMAVTPAPPPIILSHALMLADGTFKFSFTNTPGGTFTALSATNPSAPWGNWTVLGPVPEVSPGQFQFADAPTVSMGRRFYCVRKP